MRFLWLILPDQFLVLVIMLIGLGVMVGLVRLRSAGNMIGGIILVILLAPFVESFIAFLPWWLSLLIFIAIGWLLIRGFFRFVLGSGAADEMIGTLAADVVRGAFRGAFFLLFLPLRIIGRLIGRV